MKIAVLLTCFNRKVKTLSCLDSLFSALEYYNNSALNEKQISIKVFLTDDGSTDGTTDAIRSEFPSIIVLSGNGSLYWAGGMRNSWKASLIEPFDGFLLLNDDTTLSQNIFIEIIITQNFVFENFKRKSINIGSTLNQETNSLSYGGALLISKFKFSYKKIIPNGTPQSCDLGNANIMYVPSEVYNRIGMIHSSYKHGVADFDYTLMAKKKKIPVYILPNYNGICENDHKDKYLGFNKMNIQQRVKYMNSPTGLALADNILFNLRHFPCRLPIFIFFGLFKIFFPNTYFKLKKNTVI